MKSFSNYIVFVGLSSVVIFSLLLGASATSDDAGPVEVVQAAGMTEWDRINLERNLRWILARERARARAVEGGEPNDAARVGVFADAGVWHTGARSIVEALEGKGLGCRVLDRSMLRDEELKQFEAIVLPGGWAPFQWAAMGEPGLSAIRSYVERGGRCLGICAGAYMLSKTTHYEGESFPYPLGLFDGTARGPVEGLARFPEPGQARLEITHGGKRRGLPVAADAAVYYSGGPCFVGGTAIEVLARYHDGSAAAVARKVGRGEVILIGVHSERPARDGDRDDAPPPEDAGAWLEGLIFPKN
jgi:glutamine amidotransferase-like uncharacterized protein